MNRTTKRSFTATICCMLAILLLGLTLMTEIRLNAARDEIRALEKERAELERENRVLSVRLAERLPLDELERYATEVLGMQRQRSEQSVILEESGS